MRNFIRFVKSSFRFVSKVCFRSLSAIILILLRLTNLYSTVLRPELPESWLPKTDGLMEIINRDSIWIAIVIIIWAILYTFYEIDREIRDPKITKKLKGFYEDLETLLRVSITSDTDIQTVKDKLRTKEIEIYRWVEKNMERSSLIRLTQDSQTSLSNFRTLREDAFNGDHSELIDKIIGRQNRLTILIESHVWM